MILRLLLDLRIVLRFLDKELSALMFGPANSEAYVQGRQAINILQYWDLVGYFLLYLLKERLHFLFSSIKKIMSVEVNP